MFNNKIIYFLNAYNYAYNPNIKNIYILKNSQYCRLVENFYFSYIMLLYQINTFLSVSRVLSSQEFPSICVLKN